MGNGFGKATVPGKYAMSNGDGKIKITPIPDFGSRKDTGNFVPKALVTGKGNVIVFDRLAGMRRKDGPVGNDAVLYDNVADKVPPAVYDVLRKHYTDHPPIVLNGLFDSIRNGSELTLHLSEPGSYGIASGRKPSGPCHFGHKLVIETLAFFQKNGAHIFMPIADAEASLDPKIRLESQYKYYAADNLLDWGACGLNLNAAHVYLQSEEMRVVNIAYAVARKLDLASAIDIYGRETMVDEMNFLFACLTQVGDILLPQHPDFGKRHSFMLSGADQDGNMEMTTTLANRALASYEKDPDATRFVRSAPSALYVKSISNLEGKKESASEPETSIYLGPSRNVYGRNASGEKVLEQIRTLSVEERIGDAYGKIERFNLNSPRNVEEAIRRRQKLFREFAGEEGQMDIPRFKHKLSEIIVEHDRRRREVFEYAMLRAIEQGGAHTQELLRIAQAKVPDFRANRQASEPSFWQMPDLGRVAEGKRNVRTKWFDMVAKSAESLRV